MSAETAIRALLIADAPTLALVSTRIYPQRLPQNVDYPAISYQRISGVRVRLVTGPSDRAQPRIQMNLWDETYNGVQAVADAVREAMDGYAGVIGGEEINGLSIQNEFDLFDEEALDDGVYRIVQDYYVSYRE